MEKNYNSAQGRKYTNSFHKGSCIMKKKTFIGFPKDKDDKDIKKAINLTKLTNRSDNKVINFSEMIPKLLEQIKSKNSSSQNLYNDNINNSYLHDSNSSEINDDKSESDDNIISKKSSPSSPKKIPKLNFEKKDELNEYKNLEPPITYRQKRKIEKSPTLIHRKYSKENKDSLVLKLHKYFFQDGEFDNIDTLIKYNVNKIKINNEENSNQNLNINNNNNNNNLNDNININDFDYYNIKKNVINLMNKFATAFDNENKNQLVTALKGLNNFSDKYKFDYVSNLTVEWLNKLSDKIYDTCEMKYIGYYNQIRDIMDKMLKELKKKADYIIISERKKNNDIKNENNINNNNNIVNENNNINNKDNSNSIIAPPTSILKKALQKKVSLNKEDLLRTKEIVPIKIDIEIQNALNINEVEEILKNLEEGDLGDLGRKTNTANNNNKKLLNKNNNKIDNELEAFSYPFKDDSMCYIF